MCSLTQVFLLIYLCLNTKKLETNHLIYLPISNGKKSDLVKKLKNKTVCFLFMQEKKNLLMH